MYDMLKDADKKKAGQMKKNMEPPQQKKRTYKKKPVVVKTQAQAEKDLMKSLLVYKKSSPYCTHINVGCLTMNHKLAPALNLENLTCVIHCCAYPSTVDGGDGGD